MLSMFFVVLFVLAMIPVVSYWGPIVLLGLAALAAVFAFCWLAIPDICSGIKNGLGRLFA